MPKQIVPLTGLDQVGVIRDNPPVSLPPNAFSDVRNVRFKEGSVRKMEGEVNAFPNLFDAALPSTDSFDGSILKYVVWWPNPNVVDNNRGYYLVIREETVGTTIMDVAYLVVPGAAGINNQDPMEPTARRVGTFLQDRNSAWQHTFFQGGFALVINNGLQEPHYILDTDGNEDISQIPVFQPLPGWESYLINETTISDTFNAALNTRDFTIGAPVDFDAFRIVATITANNATNTFTWLQPGASSEDGGAVYAEANQLATITFTDENLPDGASVTIRRESLMPVRVRAGVVRSFGDFLVAGNLEEYQVTQDQAGSDVITVRRNLTGVVRSSDVARPGSIPTNWNPFEAGVSTADEFVLTATGVVQDMVELQGNLFIYSNNSISTMRRTGNPQVPLTVSQVTDSYGAQTTEAVLEYDGRHFVIGSQDIYLFGGHPGSIESVSDQRVRRYFFDNLNPLHNQRLFTLRYSQRDEIWICYPTTSSIQGECDEALIWNYRQNTWTIRSLESAIAGDIGPVPGGGLPTSSSSFSGNTGSNQQITSGTPEEQEINFPDLPISIMNNHAGVTTTQEFQVQGLQPFISQASSFEFNFTDQFDTGPTFGPPNVTFETAPVSMRIQLLESSDPAANLNLELPRYLTVDEQWDATRIYFAGRGLLGQPDFYGGQRAISNGIVYRVLNGFGDGTTPSSFYRPGEGLPFYDIETALVYEDTFDVLGVRPEDLVVGAQYAVTPGDGGTGRALTATQARWEALGPAATEQRGVPEVIAELNAFLTNNADFNRFFQLEDTDVTDTLMTIGAAGSSGQNNFPTYNGLMVSFAYPDLNNDPASEGGDNNGGNFGADALSIAAAASDNISATAVVFEFTTTEREYVDFDPADSANTGRYSVNPSATTLDRVVVALNETFEGDMIDERVADLIRTGFNVDPTDFWTVDMDVTGDRGRVSSRVNGNFDLGLRVIAPPETGITDANVLITEIQSGTRSTDPTQEGSIPAQLPYFLVTPPDADLARPAMFFQPVGLADVSTDRGDLMTAIIQEALRTYTNWEFVGETDDIVTVRTSNDDDVSIDARARQADRPVTGTWRVEFAAPGNVQQVGLNNTTLGVGRETVRGSFALLTTPSYLGILVSNPTIPGSGLEFLLLEAGDPTSISADAATDLWVPRIRQAVPRVSLVERADGFFLQPANYDAFANFVLDVRTNDTPENAEWIYRLATDGINIDNPDPDAALIPLNPASDSPAFVNGAELDDVFNADLVPVVTSPDYLRAGGPLKVASVLDGQGAAALASFRTNTTTTLIFDIFRPWPRDEVNFNLEYPILATSRLQQDSTGIFRRLNKIIAADIGWSRPEYAFTRRTTTEDVANFRETINMGDDFPMAYESYIERLQMAIVPEFDTEQLTSLALWADGSTPEFLRGTAQRNRLNVRVAATNNPGEISSLAMDPAATEQAGNNNMFDVSQDYKIDMRIHGRFMNYRITDSATVTEADDTFNNQTEWRISGMQADIIKGGTR